MSSKRYFVDKTNSDSGRPRTSQVGGGSKTPAKAEALRARMRARQPFGSSNSFTIREGRK